MTRKIFWFGLCLYAASFFLVAVSGADSRTGSARMRGIACAIVALVAPWAWLDSWGHGVLPVLMPAVLLVGWVNPMFLAAATLAVRKPTSRALSVLRIAITIFLFLSWIVFQYDNLRPREGFFLWVAGIVLVLYSDYVAALLRSEVPTANPT